MSTHTHHRSSSLSPHTLTDVSAHTDTHKHTHCPSWLHTAMLPDSLTHSTAQVQSHTMAVSAFLQLNNRPEGSNRIYHAKHTRAQYYSESDLTHTHTHTHTPLTLFVVAFIFCCV